MKTWQIVVSIIVGVVLIRVGISALGHEMDHVLVDQTHDVICVERKSVVLGCFNNEGQYASDEHAQHAVNY